MSRKQPKDGGPQKGLPAHSPEPQQVQEDLAATELRYRRLGKDEVSDVTCFDDD